MPSAPTSSSPAGCTWRCPRHAFGNHAVHAPRAAGARAGIIFAPGTVVSGFCFWQLNRSGFAAAPASTSSFPAPLPSPSPARPPPHPSRSEFVHRPSRCHFTRAAAILTTRAVQAGGRARRPGSTSHRRPRRPCPQPPLSASTPAAIETRRDARARASAASSPSSRPPLHHDTQRRSCSSAASPLSPPDVDAAPWGAARRAAHMSTSHTHISVTELYLGSRAAHADMCAVLLCTKILSFRPGYLWPARVV
ncbi:hypothetical protein C8R45DRAFT_1103979 [Mycena sanguinolenta]|nr:hypothetical protein C8R45DRAFT_1103979 [Mycena sanguinolenta]